MTKTAISLQQQNGKPPDRSVRSLLRDRSPSTRDASDRFVDWNLLEGQIGQPFDNTKIPLSKLEQMRRDPMIAFGLTFRKVPLIRAPWFIKCADPQIAAAVDAALRPIYGRCILAMANDMDFGFSPISMPMELGDIDGTYVDSSGPKPVEKPIWTSSVRPVVWKPFKSLSPRRAWPHWNDAGEFAGIDISESSGDGFSFSAKAPTKAPDIPISQALWSTNEKDSVFGSIYGYPTAGYAYRYWWSYWYRWALADRAFERFADPAIIVYHPPNRMDEENGEFLEYQQTALNVGDDVRSGATVAVPNSSVRDEEGRSTGQREWEITQMSDTVAFDAMNVAFEYMDALKLRALAVPEQALIEGKGGTSSRNVAATFGDALMEAQAVKKSEYDAQFNRFVIPKFVEANFGADAATATIVTRGFDPADTETMKSLVTLMANVRPDSVPIDMREILDRLGVPTISVASSQRALDEAAKQAEEQLPPPTAGDQGQSGVTAQGLYFTPREVINLSTARLPKSRHYEDPEIRERADALHKVWLDTYGWLYEDFAKHVGRQKKADLSEDLELAEGDSLARRLVNSWKPSLARLSRVAEASGVVIRQVVGLSGDKEVKTFGLGIDWSMDNAAARKWTRDRGALLVRRATDTVREEIRTFLEGELKKPQDVPGIAEAVRSHFSTFPGWKADRLARTEVRDAYNAGALLSYREAGVSNVQAFDGGGGLSRQTDPHCLERNGKVFTIEQALLEDEHPNGTLGWRPIMSTNFSVAIVPQTELPVPDSVAWWDDTSETLTLAEELNSDERREQMLLIGERLSAKGGPRAGG